MNLVHITPSYFSKIRFSIILPPKSRSSQWSLSLCFAHQNPVRVPLPSHAGYLRATDEKRIQDFAGPNSTRCSKDELHGY